MARSMSDLENLLEMLEAWLSQHRQSILDGTISCKVCRALVLDGQNADDHYAWHRTETRP